MSLAYRRSMLCALGIRPAALLRAPVLLALLAPIHGAMANPLADQAFDARCDTLPQAHFDVAAVPLTYVRDGSQTIDGLSAKSGNAVETELTLGLTTVKFGYEGDVELAVTEDMQSRRVCGALKLGVKLSMQPVVVYLAQELGSSPCAQAVTFEHEMKHVAVFRQVLAEATGALGAEIADSMGRQVRRAGNRDELERSTNAQVQDYLSGFLRRWQAILNERQSGVDSPAEHARVKNACPSSG